METVYNGLTILNKYGVDHRLSAEHDQIWVDVYWEELTDEDQKKLIDLGWWHDEDNGYCSKYV